MFVARLSPDGSRVASATYVGGRSSDEVGTMTTDVRGHVHLIGSTDSPDFPVARNPQRRAPAGTRESVMIELSADLGRVELATYVGSSGQVRSIAVDARGNRYLVGQTAGRLELLTFPSMTAAMLPAK